MLAKARAHLTYANAMATIAVFIALGAGAYAAGLAPDSVKSKHIVDGQVKNADLRDDAVTAAKLGDDAVGSPNVMADALQGGDIDEASLFNDNSLDEADVDESQLFNDNSLQGADIDEATLSGLNAAKVGGGDVCRSGGTYTLTATDIETVCTAGPFSLEASCFGVGSTVVASLDLLTSADNAYFGRSNTFATDPDFDTNESPSMTQAADDVGGTGSTGFAASFFAGVAGGGQMVGTAGLRATATGPGVGTCDFNVVSFG